MGQNLTIQAILHLPAGFPVRDATEPLTITVTELDGHLGRPNQPDSCAFSVACRRMNGNVIRSEFLKTKGYLIYVTECVRYNLTYSARKLVKQYDKKLGFPPGDYHLVPVANCDKLGAIKPRGQGTGKGERYQSRAMTYVRGRPVK